MLLAPVAQLFGTLEMCAINYRPLNSSKGEWA